MTGGIINYLVFPISGDSANMLKSKGDHMIDETKLNKTEAWFFMRCMEDELDRHKQAKHEARQISWQANDKVTRQFYEFGEIRHVEDIKMIKKTIDYLKEKWDI